MNKLNSFSREEIRNIAIEYSSSNMTRSDFCNKYFISSTTFYNMLDKAIIEHIVSYNTALKMQTKALYNKRLRLGSGKGTEQTKLHYERLFEKRRNFIFTKTERTKILKEFSKRDLIKSKSDFCEEHLFDIDLLEKMLIFSVVYNEIPKKVYNAIKENSLISINNPDIVNRFFDLLENLKEDVQTEKNFTPYELCKKVYSMLYPIVEKPQLESEENDSVSKCLNEVGDLVDDGYSIIDD